MAASLLAFLHHLAAFTLVATLALEFMLIRDALTERSARRLLVADTIYGASAAILLAVGLVRAFGFEKGAAYYFHSVPFLAKLTLFVVIALLSIVPTLEFLSWRRALKQGQVPAVSEAKLRRIRSIIHWELAAVVLILLNAALMARGIGYFG